MSTENSSTETTENGAAVQKKGKVQPDNQYQDILPDVTADVEVTATKQSAAVKVQPNNQYQDGAPKA